MDGRTTAVCRARDGKIYPLGKGPRPPAHIGCRSLRVPSVKTWKQLGVKEGDLLNERRFIADKRKFSDVPKSERDLLVGRTKAKSYNDWLKTQRRDFVEDVLGKTRAKLYLDGKMPLDKFVDRKGATLTLDELKKRNASFFKDAGL